MMRNTALGLAAIAIGVQTFRWFLSKAATVEEEEGDDNCKPIPESVSQVNLHAANIDLAQPS